MDLSRWTPIRLTWLAGEPVVDWCHTEGIVFREPFFAETVDRCLRHPFRLLFQHRTDLETLCRAVDDQPGLPPAGFIFHMSRCGSTLLAQTLAAVPAHAVASEPGPLDAVLRAAQDDRAVRWLRGMVGALGQARYEDQRRFFVKFDAWAVLDLDVLRRAFPGVPWIFLYRDPVEVLVSHARRPGAHVIPGLMKAERFGLDPRMPRLEYAARALARICEAALARVDDPLATFVDWRGAAGLHDHRSASRLVASALGRRPRPHGRRRAARCEEPRAGLRGRRSVQAGVGDAGDSGGRQSLARSAVRPLD